MKWSNVPFETSITIERIELEKLPLLIGGADHANDKTLAEIFKKSEPDKYYWIYGKVLLGVLLSEKITRLASDTEPAEIDLILYGESTGYFYSASSYGSPDSWHPEESGDERLITSVDLDFYSKEKDKYYHYEIEESSFIQLFEDEFSPEIYQTEISTGDDYE